MSTWVPVGRERKTHLVDARVQQADLYQEQRFLKQDISE